MPRPRSSGCACRLAALVLITLWADASAAEKRGDSSSLAACVYACLSDGYVACDRLVPCPLAAAACAALHRADPDLTTAWTDHGLVAACISRAGSETVIAPGQPRTMSEVVALIDGLARWVAGTGCDAEHCRDLERAMVVGALGVLDPYTTVLPPVQAHARDEALAGAFGGIGANLREVAGRLVFDGVRAGLPADQAGVHDGDCLTAIAGATVTGLTLDGVVERIKGPVGTKISLTVERPGYPARLALDLTRAEIPAITMRACRLGSVGYLRLDACTATTAADVRRALADLQVAGSLTACVLDLRHNGGGILDQACEISSLFLPIHSVIMTVVGGGRQTLTYRTATAPLTTVPLVVLVSRATASAAEILAGTLQCHGRALLVGSLTHGKGLIQAIRELPDGSQCVFSMREYRLPGDIAVQGVGILPDLAIDHSNEPESPGACVPDSDSVAQHRFLARPRAEVGLDQERSDLLHQSDDLLDPAFCPDQIAQRVADALQAVSGPSQGQGASWMNQVATTLAGTKTALAGLP